MPLGYLLVGLRQWFLWGRFEELGDRDVIRSTEAMLICEKSELQGNGGLHFMNTRAETRALKRAIETLFGSVINYYVIHHLEAAQ